MTIHSRLLLALPFLFACGQGEVVDLDRADAPDGFSVTTSHLSSPVVGFDSSGRRFVAAIDEDAGWPVFVEPDGRLVPFPDGGEGAKDLAMVVGPDDRVHAVWIADGGALYYGRVLPAQPRAREVVRLQDEDASGPTIAVSNEGEVFIAFANGWISREPNMFVAVVRGSLEGGFDGPRRVMPDCCDTWTDGVWGVNVGQAHFDDAGRIHFGYTWSGHGSWTDYVTDGRAYYLAGRVPSVAGFVDHASLLPPPYAMVFTVNELQDRVDLNHFDRRSGPAAILEAPGIMVTLAARDSDDVAHVVVNRRIEGGSVIEYLSNARGAWSRSVVADSGAEGTLHLTPRAGGLAENDGHRYVAYTRVDDDGTRSSIEVVRARVAD